MFGGKCGDSSEADEGKCRSIGERTLGQQQIVAQGDDIDSKGYEIRHEVFHDGWERVEGVFRIMKTTLLRLLIWHIVAPLCLRNQA